MSCRGFPEAKPAYWEAPENLWPPHIVAGTRARKVGVYFGRYRIARYVGFFFGRDTGCEESACFPGRDDSCAEDGYSTDEMKITLHTESVSTCSICGSRTK